MALARALINRPAVLLLDEPLGALDLKLRKQMQVELKRIQQEVGITFIYVTHDQEEAMTMSDRIAVMNKGRYEQLGDPEGLYERPTTRFVAGFLGISNLLPATVAGTADGYAHRPARRRRPGPGAERRWSTATRTSRSASDPRRSGCTRPTRTSRPAPTSSREPSSTPRTSGCRRPYVVEARTGARLTVYEQNVERTVHGSLYRPGDAVRLSWSPDHTSWSRADPVPAEAGAGVTGPRRPPREVPRRHERAQRTIQLPTST